MSTNLSNQQVLDELKHCNDFAHKAKSAGLQNYPEAVVEYANLHYQKRHGGLTADEKQQKVLLKPQVSEYFNHLAA